MLKKYGCQIRFKLFLKPVNDEAPVAIFEPLFAEFNKPTIITNETLLIVDLDSKPENIIFEVEEVPRHGQYTATVLKFI